ncbi:MAG: MFS transporter, partial [Cutibacterium avidum]|nr:MFS transporter [Cutibacterium avidum]
MRGYRDVIAIREVWTTLLLSALIRIPIFSLGIVMSVH